MNRPEGRLAFAKSSRLHQPNQVPAFVGRQPGERGASAPRWKRRRHTPAWNALRAGGCGSPQTVELPGVAAVPGESVALGTVTPAS